MASSIYRTKGGMILRIIEADDGGLKVETLTDDEWVAGRIGMAGLRLSPSTVRLSSKEAEALPE